MPDHPAQLALLQQLPGRPDPLGLTALKVSKVFKETPAQLVLLDLLDLLDLLALAVALICKCLPLLAPIPSQYLLELPR